MSRTSELINAMLGRLDLQVVRRSSLEEQRQMVAASRQLMRRLHVDPDRPASPAAAPSAEARAYLRPDNPRLVELKQRYRAFRHAVMERSIWGEEYVEREVDLSAFRGDNAYIWQYREATELHYLLTYFYLASGPRAALLSRLDEDGQFGVQSVTLADGRKVSRDLLDSVIEIDFLERELGLSRLEQVRVLDIGAGYGRFAYRLVSALPNVTQVLCTDAVAESTFLCEYYLRLRGVDDRARAVPADEIERVLAGQPIDLAVNIHSFTECVLGAITGWLDIVRAHRVPHLMIVPNRLTGEESDLSSREQDRTRVPIEPEIVKRGYRRVVRRAKYDDPLMQQHGVTPTWYYLFRLDGSS